jgi:hypothetical protein
MRSHHLATPIALAALALVLAAGCEGRPAGPAPKSAGRPAAVPRVPAPPAVPETFPDPNAPGTGARVTVDPGLLDGQIFATARPYTGPVANEADLASWREAVGGRARRGLQAIGADLEALEAITPTTPEELMRALWTLRSGAMLALYAGDFAKAATYLDKGLTLASNPAAPAEARASLRALRGIAALRRGEVENCVGCIGPSSCVFPIAPTAVHGLDAGSREAVRQFTAYLEERPDDLRVRWLLNLASMTLGEHPSGVPPRFLIPVPPEPPAPPGIGRFTNVATLVGLDARGPGQAGGAIFDDFNGDDLLDLLITSFDAEDGASLYLNKGDGTFADHSAASGLKEQIYALNVARADYDNDGDNDAVLLRGGWESPVRMSLLRNRGDATFEDVTRAAGLGDPIASEVAVWGDYDNDGLVDLFVGGEYLPPIAQTPPPIPDGRNRCRLYRNQGDGTFRDVASTAGVANGYCTKGAAWGDFDSDGLLDLFVSNMNGPPRLYRNRGDGTFADGAASAGLVQTPSGFTCVPFDIENDGDLDLYVSEYSPSLAETVGYELKLPVHPSRFPRLYRNRGDGTFEDVAPQAGLDRPLPAMSANVGDVDNDGFLDLYLGIGWMSYSGLVPDRLFRNEGGTRFADITRAAGTGHLQKGHGVSFGDWDEDGDADIAVVFGGGYPGDKGYPGLFQNPGNANRWLKLRLVGTRTNRSALGARIKAEIKLPDGTTRAVHRVVGNNGSFGGNTLVETIGLGASESVAKLTIAWPTSRTTQTFADLPAGRTLVLTEGQPEPRVLERKPLPQPDLDAPPRRPPGVGRPG